MDNMYQRINNIEQQAYNQQPRQYIDHEQINRVEAYKKRVCNILGDFERGDYELVAKNLVADELKAILNIQLPAEDMMFFQKKLNELNNTKNKNTENKGNFKSAEELTNEARKGNKKKESGEKLMTIFEAIITTISGGLALLMVKEYIMTAKAKRCDIDSNKTLVEVIKNDISYIKKHIEEAVKKGNDHETRITRLEEKSCRNEADITELKRERG